MKATAGWVLFFFCLLLVGCNDQPVTSKLLIDEAESIRIHHELDSLYLVGDYSSAIEQAQILLNYYENKNDRKGQVVCLNYLGDYLRSTGNREGSLESLNAAMELLPQLHDSLLLAQTCNYLGATFFEQDFPKYMDSTIHYARLSMAIALQNKDENLIYSNLNLLGMAKMGQGDLDSALFYLKQALKIVRRASPVDEPLVLCNIAGIYYRKGDLTEAKKLSLQAFKQAKANDVNAYIRTSSILLEKFYLLEGNYREAYHYLSELSLYTRNFMDEKVEGRMALMNEQFRQAENNATVQKELELRRLFTLSVSILLAFSLVFIILFSRQKSRLRKTNRELQISNNTLKNFISIMAHDLKSPFNTIIGFSELLKNEFDALTPEERKLAVENTNKSALNAFALLEQLLDWARLQTGTFHLEATSLDLSEVVDEVIHLHQASAFLKKQTLVNKILPGFRVVADRNMLLAVFRNLLSNAIKFTPEKGVIEVSAIESGSTIQAMVKDSGVGISADAIKKLFCIDVLYKTVGTNGEKGTGIGLLLCKDYLEKNLGSIAVESVEGNGTTFRITLPKALS